MSIFKKATIWLVPLAMTAFIGCGADDDDDGTKPPVEEDTSLLVDTDDQVDTSELDTGPGDTDTTPYGASCEKPLVLEPGVKHVRSGGNAIYEWPNDHDWFHNSCYLQGGSCPCLDACREADQGLASDQSCYDGCVASDPDCANSCYCFQDSNYEWDDELIRCGQTSGCFKNCKEAILFACDALLGGEIILQVTATPNQQIVVKNEGGGNLFFKEMTGCNDAEAECTFTEGIWSPKNDGDDIFAWSPSEAGDYMLVIESQEGGYGISSPNYYLEIGLFELTETVCNDSLDDDGDGLFDCVDPECFSTCGITPTVTETFDSTIPPTWTANPSSGTMIWKFSTDGNQTESVSDGGFAMAGGSVYPQPVPGGVILETPSINRQLSDKVVLTFAEQKAIYYPTEQEIQVSTDGLTWTTIVRYSEATSEHRSSQDRGQQVVDLTGALEGATSFQLRFVYNENGHESSSRLPSIGWRIDDLNIIEGDFPVLGETQAYVPSAPPIDNSASGCDQSQTVCHSLHGHDFGSGTDSLGWFYNGERCQEAAGALSTKDSYCFFDTPKDCATVCADEGKCNNKALIGPSWPDNFGYTYAILAMCADPAEQADILANLPSALSLEENSDSFHPAGSCDSNGGDATDWGTEISTVTPPIALKSLKEDKWPHICALSLLPYDIELLCVAGGLPTPR